jgi:RNA polymerase sigma-70 factor, ECF subfamily
MIYSTNTTWARWTRIRLFGELPRLMSDELSELEGLRALDPQAITAIYNRYYPETYRFACYRLGDETAAEDIAAEVFLHLLEAIQAGRGPDKNLRGWLIGTTANLVNDHFRRSYARPSTELTENHLDEAPKPPELAEYREGQHKILTALMKLTEEQQRVITLRFGGGCSLEETALIMDKKPNAIKALQFRALEALRRIMGEDNA